VLEAGRIVKPPATGVGRPNFTADFDEFETVLLIANGDDNAITDTGVAAGVDLQVLAGAGDDAVTLGGGDLDDNVLGNVTLDGTAGNDRITFDDSADDLGDDVLTLGLTRLTKGSAPPIDFLQFNQTTIRGGPQSTVYDLHRHNDPLTVIGGVGDDTFNLATASTFAGDLDNAFPFGLPFIDAGPGHDKLVLDDRNDAGDDAYLVDFGTDVNQQGRVQKSRDGGGVAETRFVGVDALDLAANGFANTITVDNAFDTTIDASDGEDLVFVEGTSGPEPLRLDAGAGLDFVEVNANAGTGQSFVAFERDQTLSILLVLAGGALELAAGAGLVVDVLGQAIVQPIQAAGLVDLNDNALVLRNTGSGDRDAVRQRIALGYAGGTWAGTTGFTSSVARDSVLADGLGYGTAASLGLASVSGVAVAGSDLVVKYALLGDANLDGTVDLADFGRLRGGFGTGSLWNEGDANYDGVVDLTDFGLLRGTFGQAL